MKDNRNVLFISDGSHWSRRAAEFLDQKFATVDWFVWNYGTPKERSFDSWPGCDVLLSFKADFIVPNEMLTRVRETALNFHPSIPDYRGIGGYRYALDDGMTQFGVTCHFITPELDAGPIIDVVRFPIRPDETESKLKERTAEVALGQFMRVVSDLNQGRPLAADTTESWGERLYTRAGLDAYRNRRLARTASL